MRNRLGSDKYREEFEVWLKILGTRGTLDSNSSDIFQDQTPMEFSDRGQRRY